MRKETREGTEAGGRTDGCREVRPLGSEPREIHAPHRTGAECDQQKHRLFYGDILYYYYHYYFVFLGLHPWHTEVPRLGVTTELLMQRWILNPLSEAGDQTHKLMVPSGIRFRRATMETPL